MWKRYREETECIIFSVLSNIFLFSLSRSTTSRSTSIIGASGSFLSRFSSFLIEIVAINRGINERTNCTCKVNVA